MVRGLDFNFLLEIDSLANCSPVQAGAQVGFRVGSQSLEPKHTIRMVAISCSDFVVCFGSQGSLFLNFNNSAATAYLFSDCLLVK